MIEHELSPEVMAEARLIFSGNMEGVSACWYCVLPGQYIGNIVPSSVESTRIGDSTMSVDGSWGNVVDATTHQYNGGVKTIHARAALPLTVTDEHEILVFPALNRRKGAEGWKNRQKVAPANEKPIWRRADAVQPGDFAVCPIPRIDGPEPPARWSTPDAVFLLGMIVGDGSTTVRDGRRYHLELTLNPKKPVSEAKSVLSDMGFRVSETVRGNSVRLIVSSRSLAEEVAELVGVGSPNKHFPPFVWHSKELLAAALEGIMATDGCRKTHKGFESRDMTTTSQALAWQVWYMALALGEKPYISDFKRSSGYPNAKPVWHVRWTFGARREFTARTDEFYVMPVRKVESSEYDGPVHDITVEPNHTFVANGLLTHNCGGIHIRVANLMAQMQPCPRVRKIEWNPNGETVQSVEFWPNGQWEDSVVFPQDVWADDEAGE
jgi:hypothetical protein